MLQTTEPHRGILTLLCSKKLPEQGFGGVSQKELDVCLQEFRGFSWSSSKEEAPPQARDGMYGCCWILLKSLLCACHSVILSLPPKGKL